jgi:hypothetical protein
MAIGGVVTSVRISTEKLIREVRYHVSTWLAKFGLAGWSVITKKLQKEDASRRGIFSDFPFQQSESE